MELLERVEADDICVVELTEENLDGSNVGAFRQAIAATVESRKRVVIDLTRVKFVDSSGLGALISCQRQMNVRHGELRVCSMTPTVKALFELMRMQRVFNIQPSRADALKSF